MTESGKKNGTILAFLRARIAYKLRTFGDRIDPNGAPRRTHLSFTFEPWKGLVINENGHGCPLWYYGMADYERAHSESRTP